MQDAVGWISSVVLLVTITSQIAKQWRERSSQGVSTWLFVGQVVASVGFVAYSWMVGNWIFVVTNALILASAIVGVVVTRRNKRAEGSDGVSAPQALPARRAAGHNPA